MCEMPEARTNFGLRQKVTFDNHINSLAEISDDIQQRLHIRTPQHTPSPSPSGSSASESESGSPTKQPRTRGDQFCVYENVDSAKKLRFLTEYKPPHKLSMGNLQAGLRDMDLKKNIFDRMTIPVFSEHANDSINNNEAAKQAKLQYNADRLITAVITQTFHTIIEFGLKYSFITTSEALVQLHVKENDPTTLYYHLSIPKEDVHETNNTTSLSQTAVSQVITICLIAFQSTQRSHEWRRAAKKKLRKYRTDYEAVLREIPKSERKKTPSIAYRGRKLPIINKSPYMTRQRAQNTAVKAGCSEDALNPSGNDDDEPDAPPEPSRGSNSRLGRSSHYEGKVASGTAIKHKGRKENKKTQKKHKTYCTQACMLGILREGMMDKNCPNILRHPSSNGYHELDAPKLVALVQQQLAADVDHGCEPLGLQGARGALFRICLASHSYVLVAKGMLHKTLSYMLHEVDMYQRLQPLQGDSIPVCLGHFCLKHRYYLGLGVKIRYMILMAWGGDMLEDMEKYHIQIAAVISKVRNYGVEQDDVRRPNLLWSEEKQQVMLIDFERAMCVSSDAASTRITKRPVLRELPSNTRWKRQKVNRGKGNAGENTIDAARVELAHY